MTNAISKLHREFETWSFKYNCYEAVHPWTPFCSYSALDVGLTVFGEAIKLYTPLYLVGTSRSSQNTHTHTHTHTHARDARKGEL